MQNASFGGSGGFGDGTSACECAWEALAKETRRKDHERKYINTEAALKLVESCTGAMQARCRCRRSHHNALHSAFPAAASTSRQVWIAGIPGVQAKGRWRPFTRRSAREAGRVIQAVTRQPIRSTNSRNFASDCRLANEGSRVSSMRSGLCS